APPAPGWRDLWRLFLGTCRWACGLCLDPSTASASGVQRRIADEQCADHRRRSTARRRRAGLCLSTGALRRSDYLYRPPTAAPVLIYPPCCSVHGGDVVAELWIDIRCGDHLADRWRFSAGDRNGVEQGCGGHRALTRSHAVAALQPLGQCATACSTRSRD